MLKRVIIIISLLLILPVSITLGNKEKFTFEQNMITVKRISFPCVKPPIKLIENMMDSVSVQFHNIDNTNWPGYSYKPEVSFRIAYSKDEIYIQYRVKEKYIRAFYTKDEGSAPYEDSCVEFFIIPGESDTIYYNLELNCIGVGTFAGGPNRKERTRFGTEVTSQIRRLSTLVKKNSLDKDGNILKEGFDTKEGDFEWSLTIALPIKLFSLNKIAPLSGRSVKANFYKCGDDLPEPHYLSWNKVGTERPNFHTPEYFGILCFE